MYPFPQSVNPALRSHIDAQIAFFNELSQAVSRSFQQVGQLNMQLNQTLFEEVANAGQRLLTTERPTDAMSVAAAHAQPATEKLRAYQQHLSQLAASTQVDLTRVTEQHVQETSRTARALADDVTRAAAEETDKSLRQQEDTIKNFRDPFEEGTRGDKTGAQFQGNLQSGGDEASARVEADGPAGKVSAQGNMQGNQARPPSTRPPASHVDPLPGPFAAAVTMRVPPLRYRHRRMIVIVRRLPLEHGFFYSQAVSTAARRCRSRPRARPAPRAARRPPRTA